MSFCAGAYDKRGYAYVRKTLKFWLFSLLLVKKETKTNIL